MREEEKSSDSVKKSGRYTIVGFDLDTTGRKLEDDICHIGGFYRSQKGENVTYSQYIMPNRTPNPAARQAFSIRVVNIGRSRILKDLSTGEVLKTKTEISGLKDFLNWLEKAGAGTDGVILTSHEQDRKILVPLFIKSLERSHLLQQCSDIIKGFCNSTDVISSISNKELITSLSLRSLCKTVLRDTNLPTSRAVHRCQRVIEILYKLSDPEIQSKEKIPSQDQTETRETSTSAETETRETLTPAETETRETSTPAETETRETSTLAETETRETLTPAVTESKETSTPAETETRENSTPAETEARETSTPAETESKETSTPAEIKTSPTMSSLETTGLTEPQQKKLQESILLFVTTLEEERENLCKLEKTDKIQSTLRPVFEDRLGEGWKVRERMLRIRRALAEANVGYKKLEESRRSGKLNQVLEPVNLQEEEKNELLKILEKHFKGSCKVH
ncbi:maternal protein exuperantia-1 [Eurytemora carolleeae]|uniref:maternal protein exuperantia-1 n=1 Tax=Eurytemora carolleeae TaxID=1294199 RepID=UPI000C78D8CF|nr:maternal protein exuperantia-1 [Eurytemora carolleeae]|eukprot:XP_023333544.1 maternal protein exuperantia-1-like [Eurytemora affinis]